MRLPSESDPIEYYPQDDNRNNYRDNQNYRNNNDSNRNSGSYQSDLYSANGYGDNYQNNGNVRVNSRTPSELNSDMYSNDPQNIRRQDTQRQNIQNQNSDYRGNDYRDGGYREDGYRDGGYQNNGYRPAPQDNGYRDSQNFGNQQQYSATNYRHLENQNTGYRAEYQSDAENSHEDSRVNLREDLRENPRVNPHINRDQSSQQSLFKDEHSPMEELVVKVQGVKFKRGFKELYQGLNAEFQPGTVTGIIGRNGVGKSTLISLISGELRPHSGIITVNDIPVNEIPSRARVFGVVSESYGLPSGMKTKNALKYWCHVIDAPLSRIDKLIKDLEMESFLNTRVRRLSTGQRKKVELAFALLGDQNILLLDEPFNGLDVETSGLIRSVISSLQNEGKTILLITHILTDIDRLASSSYVLTDGLFYKLEYPAGVPGAVEDAYNKLMRRGKYAR